MEREVRDQVTYRPSIKSESYPITEILSSTILEQKYLCSNTNLQSTIKRQRPDRVNLMMDSLQCNGCITAVKVLNATFYQITEKGVMKYAKWIRNFLEFAMRTQDGF
jgi:hypothetical protein